MERKYVEFLENVVDVIDSIDCPEAEIFDIGDVDAFIFIADDEDINKVKEIYESDLDILDESGQEKLCELIKYIQTVLH